ncbi:HugZ family protein [Roseococcus sp. DSY-14]|uniref:HugZ family pyridoxamine 5'-phosphate oxidase n=1 Tax=Roseococcus sp. DSY-14 TaxID=3369650 RepID=UPI00387AE965
MTEDTAFQARQLIRAARSATLATQADGQPFAALVTPATAPDLSVLLWLSTLSEHTRQLGREGRCALLFTGEAETANPQTAPRVTLTGVAERIEDAALKARWLARHPYAALYADFSDFALWRVRPGAALLVGGFARATRLRAEALAPGHEAVAAAEAGILAHVNQDHADAVRAIAAALGGADGPWRLSAVDPEGCDLLLGEAVLRLPFAAPARSPDAVRAALVRAAREARLSRGGAGR